MSEGRRREVILIIGSTDIELHALRLAREGHTVILLQGELAEALARTELREPPKLDVEALVADLREHLDSPQFRRKERRAQLAHERFLAGIQARILIDSRELAARDPPPPRRRWRNQKR